MSVLDVDCVVVTLRSSPVVSVAGGEGDRLCERDRGSDWLATTIDCGDGFATSDAGGD